MRLFLLTALTMIAFAANSILNRQALAAQLIDPVAFGQVRLVAGAATLTVLSLALARGHGLLRQASLAGVLSLFVYVFGFSAAYVALDAGLGALLLFGTVQLTMIVGAILRGERPGPRRLVGAAVAFLGLAWLLWPAGGGAAPAALPAVMMIAAGVGWGIYSLAGRRVSDPLSATAANFLYAAVAALALWVVMPTGAAAGTALSTAGLALAVISGAVTSGLGYALWYHVLPLLQATQAAVAQLTVPVIALAGGALLLGEAPGASVILASAVVLGGVALSVSGRTG